MNRHAARQHTAGHEMRERLLAGSPVVDRRLSIGGVATAALEGGAGPPILFVQVEHALVWSRILPDLVNTHSVVAPDLPGLGESALPDGGYDIDGALRWLRELIETTCDGPPVLVGKGPGGALAARFAVREPDLVRGLVLVDAHGLKRFRLPPRMALSYFGVMMHPTEPRVERSLGTYCFTDLDRVRGELGEHWWELFLAYTVNYFRTTKVKKTMRTLMPRLARAIPPEDLAGITAPTSLIWGRHDIGMPVEVAEAASRRYAWPLHVIDGARDDPAIEQPEAFLHALRAALDRSQPSRSQVRTQPDE